MPEENPGGVPASEVGENPGGIPVSEEELNPTIPRLGSAEEILIDYIAQNKPHININILLSLLKDNANGFKNPDIRMNLFPRVLPGSKSDLPLPQLAISDYIMTTPGNFNPNILRETLTNEDALHALTATYTEKIGKGSGESEEIPLGPAIEDPGWGTNT